MRRELACAQVGTLRHIDLAGLLLANTGVAYSYQLGKIVGSKQGLSNTIFIQSTDNFHA